MSEQQITDLLNVSLNNIKDMLRVDLIVGTPIHIGEKFLIPIARVKCGFVSGGMNNKNKKMDLENNPFAGATGGSLTLSPIGFVSVCGNELKILHLDEGAHILDRTIDGVSDLLFSLMGKNKKEEV